MATKVTYPDDWVELKGPVAFTQALRDGAHYTSNSQGRVTVRPYHVQEMIGRGYTATDPAIEEAIGAALTQLPFITPDDVSGLIAKAATKQAKAAADAADAKAAADKAPSPPASSASTAPSPPARA